MPTNDAQQLRVLQIFRNNGVIQTNDVATLKQTIESAWINGNITLHDGEPVSIRYSLSGQNEIKGLFGVAYVNGTAKKILWGAGEEITNIITHRSGDERSEDYPEGIPGDDYIELKSTQQGGTVEITATANVVDIEDASTDNDGLATALDVKNSRNQYKIVESDTATDGYLKTYKLQTKTEGSSSWSDVTGSKIDIPKDFFLKSAEIFTWDGMTPASIPGYDDAVAEDKFIKFIVNVDDPDMTDEKIVYLKVNDIVDAYTGSTTINISDSNVISVDLANKNYKDLIEVEDSSPEQSDGGLYSIPYLGDGTKGVEIERWIGSEYAEGIGHKISVKLSEASDNRVVFDTDGGLYVPDLGGASITDVKIETNTGSETKYYKIDSTGQIVEGDGSTAGEQSVDPGHRKILIATSEPKLFASELPISEDTYTTNVAVADTSRSGASGQDINFYRTDIDGTPAYRFNIHSGSGANDFVQVATGFESTGSGVDAVSGVKLTATAKTVAIANVTDSNDGLATAADVASYVKDATIANNTSNDTLVVSQKGIVNQDAISQIEAYIDNYDCGTFTLASII